MVQTAPLILTRPSRMMARQRPMLAPGARLNFVAPCGVRENATSVPLVCGSTAVRAGLRSRPVMTDSRFTR